MPVLPVSADELSNDVAVLQHEWASIKYQSSEGAREKLFEALAEKAQQVTARYPDKAEPLIWKGIILSTGAGAKGGFGALSLAEVRDHMD